MDASVLHVATEIVEHNELVIFKVHVLYADTTSGTRCVRTSDDFDCGVARVNGSDETKKTGLASELVAQQETKR